VAGAARAGALAAVLLGVMVAPGALSPARGAEEGGPSPAPSAAGPAGIECSPRTASFEAYQHETAVVRFTCTNHGARAARVTKVEPRGAGGWAAGAPRALGPGESAEFEVHQPLANALGAASYRVGISTDDPQSPIVRVGLAGFVQSAYEPERGALELGWVDAAVGKETPVPQPLFPIVDVPRVMKQWIKFKERVH